MDQHAGSTPILATIRMVPALALANEMLVVSRRGEDVAPPATIHQGTTALIWAG